MESSERSSEHFMDWHAEPRLAGKLLFHGFDDVVRHERLAVVFANVAMGVEARLAAQVAGELAAVIVFDDDDLLALRKDAADLGGMKRDNPLDVKLIGHDAFFTGQLLDGFENDALGRAP